jgi:hypothetical protein
VVKKSPFRTMTILTFWGLLKSWLCRYGLKSGSGDSKLSPPYCCAVSLPYIISPGQPPNKIKHPIEFRSKPKPWISALNTSLAHCPENGRLSSEKSHRRIPPQSARSSQNVGGGHLWRDCSAFNWSLVSISENLRAIRKLMISPFLWICSRKVHTRLICKRFCLFQRIRETKFCLRLKKQDDAIFDLRVRLDKPSR